MSAVKIIAIGDNVCDKYLSRGKMYPGGQCVNTCAYAAANGVPSAYLGKFGSDEVAAYNQKILHELGIDISHALQVPGGTTSTYLFLNDMDGDMALAVSDMEICEKLQPEYFAANLNLLNRAQLVVADTNLPQASLEYLASHCIAPIFVDPVSTHKAEKLHGVLGKIHTLKPNRIEAELLSGVKITDEGSLHRAAQTLLDTGLRRVFISLGSDGVFAADHNGFVHQPCLPAKVANATGAGDAFMAALAWAYLEGTDLKDTAALASAAASIAIEGAETINPVLSVESVRERVNVNK